MTALSNNGFPSFADIDLVDDGIGNPKHHCQFLLGFRFLLQAFLHEADVFVAEFCSAGKFSACRLSPSLGVHIRDVRSLIAYEKVVRINARTIIAFMKNVSASWYWTILQLPRKSMSKTITYHSVTGNCSTTDPNPASISFFNFAPKPRLDVLSPNFLTAFLAAILCFSVGDFTWVSGKFTSAVLAFERNSNPAFPVERTPLAAKLCFSIFNLRGFGEELRVTEKAPTFNRHATILMIVAKESTEQ